MDPYETRPDVPPAPDAQLGVTELDVGKIMLTGGAVLATLFSGVLIMSAGSPGRCHGATHTDALLQQQRQTQIQQVIAEQQSRKVIDCRD